MSKVYLVKIDDYEDGETMVKINSNQKELLDFLENENFLRYQILENDDIPDISSK